MPVASQLDGAVSVGVSPVHGGKGATRSSLGGGDDASTAATRSREESAAVGTGAGLRKKVNLHNRKN